MAGRLLIPDTWPCHTANGEIDPGASIQFYANGTTTPQVIYATAAAANTNDGLTGTLDNPLTPDAAGRCPDIWAPNGYVYTVEHTPTGESAITHNDIGIAGDPAPPTQYLPVSRSVQAVLTDNQRVISWNVPFYLTLAAGLNDGIYPSIFTINTNPTATLTLTLKKNSTTIGTIAFSTSGVPTVTFTSQVDFVPTDKFYVLGQASADATGAGIDLTFVFRQTQ